MEFSVNISMVEAVFILAALGLAVRLIIWYANVNSDRKSFNEFMDYIRGRIDEIFDRLPNPLTKDASPLRLSDSGEEISKKINAPTIADAMSSKLRPEVAGKSPYEIQQLCFRWVSVDKLADDQKALVQDAAFSRGPTLSQIMEVIAIEVRDRLLTPEQQESLP